MAKSNAGKIRVSIIDRNGKSTHVWRTQEEINAEAKRLEGNVPTIASTASPAGQVAEEHEGVLNGATAADNPFRGSKKWNETIDLKDVVEGELSMEQQSELITARIKDSKWYADKQEEDDPELEYALDDLAGAADSGNTEWFETAWNEIYNLADNDRVWLETV